MPAGPVTWASYCGGVRVNSGTDLTRADFDRDDASTFIWLDLSSPTAQQFAVVADHFDLHPLAVEDAVHAHQRPKLEIYGDSLFLVLKTARYVDEVEIIEIGETMAFLGRGYLITVGHGGAGISDVRTELDSRPEVLGIGPSAVLWSVADRVVDEYGNATAGLSEDVAQVEAAVFAAERSSPTERIYKLKREVIEFRRAVEPLAEAFDCLVAGEVQLVDERTIAYFRDVQDHALREASRLRSFDENLAGILQANVAMVTLRQNEDVRKITAWAAILASITAIAGIYGMNFENMPELKWANGYYLALGAMVALSVGLYVMFRRRRWL